MTIDREAGCRRAIALACAFLLGQSGAAYAQSDREACKGSINYEDADISAVVDDIALRTGKKFVISPQVSGRITIKSGPNGGLCPNEAWELFQAALRVTGFVATPINGDSYKIVPLQFGARAGGPVGEGQPGDFVTQIARLEHVDARAAAASLSQIVSERGVVNPVSGGNALILVDSADNVARMRQVLAEIDRDTRVYQTVSLQNASAVEVAGVVRELGQELGAEGGGAAGISIVPVEATNSLIIRAEPTLLRRVMNVVGELDRIGESTSELAVVRLSHQDAETLAVTLRELADAQPQEAGVEGAPARAGRARATISVDKPTNSIIISGDKSIQQTLKRAIYELDLRPAQVQVEAIIVEISENTARQLGIEYLISGSGDGVVPFTTTNFTDSQADFLGAAASSFLSGGSSTTNTTGDPLGLNNEVLQLALSSLLGLNGIAVGGAGRTDDGTLYSAIVTAVKQDVESNVLSFPSVVTLDNQPARLQVGQEIPITTGEAVGQNFQNSFRTVSREEVGVILEVTPRISDGNTVTLKIKQETSSVAGQIIASSTDLITNKRTIETVALVDDGDILVVGGLIDQTDQNRESKVPVLGDIPLAGNLFKNSGRSRDRRNLMVFIRPTIIRDQKTARAATAKKVDYIRARGMLNNGAPTSDLERLIDQTTGVAPAPAGNLRSTLPVRPEIDAGSEIDAPAPLREDGE
ncbi:MAG: type II secretion system protein GspD [Alphaproteobacteria bacterium]|nr:type II secretion system protein GspD [Alphaproteobacteria bacterium]